VSHADRQLTHAAVGGSGGPASHAWKIRLVCTEVTSRRAVKSSKTNRWRSSTSLAATWDEVVLRAGQVVERARVWLGQDMSDEGVDERSVMRADMDSEEGMQ